jgi:hypothetical protein
MLNGMLLYQIFKNAYGFQDGPSKTLLNYMQQFDFDAPDDWKGYRELTDK